MNIGVNYSHLTGIREISRSFSKKYRYDTDNTDKYSIKMTIDLSCNILTSREKELDDISTFNFYGKYKLFKGYLTLGVDNIFDEEIQVSGDMTSTSTNQYVYYGMGRLFKLGYEIKF